MEEYAEEQIMLDFAFFRFLSHKYPICGNVRTYADNHMNTYHNHDFPQVWYCYNGTYINRVKDIDYVCTRGSLVIVPPGVCHQIRVPKGETAEIAHLNLMYDFPLNCQPEKYINTIANLFLPPFEGELGNSFPTHINLGKESQAVIEECMSWISVLKYTQQNISVHAEIFQKLELLLSVPELALSEQYRERAIWLVQARLNPTLRVLSYLNTNYAIKLLEEDVVRVSAICRANMYRYFKQFTGYTYSQYLQRLRTRYVYIYLKFTTYPLSYISDMCGFYDISHMSKVYYKYMGVKPKNFRKEKKKWLEENPENRIRLP